MSISERTHSIIWVTDKSTGIKVRKGVEITRCAEEEVALYNSYDSPVTFSTEALASDWREHDPRFDEYTRLNANDSYTPKPFIKHLKSAEELNRVTIMHFYDVPFVVKSDPDGEQNKWVRHMIDSACQQLYQEAIKKGLSHPFTFESAVFKGFIQTHFKKDTKSNWEHFEKFVSFVGKEPTIERLDEIALYIRDEIRNYFLCTKDIPSLCDYIHIISGISLDIVTKHVRQFEYEYSIIDGSAKTLAIHEKASLGDVEQVQRLCSEMSLDAPDKQGFTALHHAVRSGNEELVHFIMTQKAEVNACYASKSSLKGYTPLHIAAKKGHDGIVQLLAKNSAALNAQDMAGDTPLHLASRFGRAQVVQTLLGLNADTTVRNLAGKKASEVAYEYHQQILPLFGIDVQERIQKREKSMLDRLKHAEALVASLKNSVSSSDIALPNAIYRADLQEVYDALHEMKPFMLHYACSRGGKCTVLHTDTERAYFSNNFYEENCGIFLSLNTDYLPIIHLLLHSGLSINEQDEKGMTPLHKAAKAHHFIAVWYLLRNGANPNIADCEGNTPLHLSFPKNYFSPTGPHTPDTPQIVDLLIRAGADRTIRNNEGKLASELALANKRFHSYSIL